MLLGRFYSLSGTVIRGDQRGRTLGFPTANIRIADALKLIPQQGVYATIVQLGKRFFRGVTNIGTRPTFHSEGGASIETHVLNFDESIYGQQLTLQFVNRLRDEQRFDTSDDLIERIRKDIASASSISF
jgi:riboflavin kinase/FMN adenylyltransferase